MKRLHLGALLLFVLHLLIMPVSVGADSATELGGAGFSVKAVLPENQNDSGETFFDLWMEPGQKQVLKVDVFNYSDEEISVEVSAVSASTSRHGVIDYLMPNVRDKTLKIPFSEIAEIKNPQITIPAGQTASASVMIDMPNESFDGVVLGGLVFTRVNKDGNTVSDADGVKIENGYNYVIAAKLLETTIPVLPDFELDTVDAELVYNRIGIVY